MSYGIVCLTCRKYLNVGVQKLEHAYACKCEQPRYSENAVSEISKEQAEKYALAQARSGIRAARRQEDE
ncbi:MAG: hypothetical protein ACRENP_12235 [Longimicrobiales bacterium]